MNTSPRLTKNDSLADIIAKLAEGNVVAARLLSCMFGKALEKGDWTALFMLTAVQQLDHLGIYGERIVRLHSVVCRDTLLHLTTLLECFQSRLLSAEAIEEALEAGSTFNFEYLLAQLEYKVGGFHAGFKLRAG